MTGGSGENGTARHDRLRFTKGAGSDDVVRIRLVSHPFRGARVGLLCGGRYEYPPEPRRYGDGFVLGRTIRNGQSRNPQGNRQPMDSLVADHWRIPRGSRHRNTHRHCHRYHGPFSHNPGNALRPLVDAVHSRDAVATREWQEGGASTGIAGVWRRGYLDFPLD